MQLCSSSLPLDMDSSRGCKSSHRSLFSCLATAQGLFLRISYAHVVRYSSKDSGLSDARLSLGGMNWCAARRY